MSKDEIDPAIPKAPESEQVDGTESSSQSSKIDPAIPKPPKSEVDAAESKDENKD